MIHSIKTHRLTLLSLAAAALYFSPVLATTPLPPAITSLEEMTWPEVKDALAHGKTTVLVPTGGTEQTGPHIVTGKHNFILHYTMPRIAEKLGDALVAPLLPVVPEGSIEPPAGHMMFPGTLSLQPQTFAALLEDIVRSLKQHGFKTICLIGEHGASQDVQRKVAEKLTAEWANQGVRVIHVSDYYGNNGQGELVKELKLDDPNPQAHGGLADTSEMMKAYEQGVRGNLRGAHTAADFPALGVDGSSDRASADLGELFLQKKIDAAVKQIQKERIVK